MQVENWKMFLTANHGALTELLTNLSLQFEDSLLSENCRGTNPLIFNVEEEYFI